MADANKSVKTSAAGASINLDDIEKNKKDVASLNSDLQLLSTLLGRPVSQKDLSQLTKSGGTGLTPAPAKSTVSPAQLAQEVIQQIGAGGDKQHPSDGAGDGDNNLTSTDELASIDPSDAYGKTNDALLATLLKQRGIGPAHNNIPLDIYSTTTTTERPIRLQGPSRSPRPLLDGLSWLWKTWQDTSPGNGGYQPQSSRTRTRGANSDAASSPLTDINIDEPGGGGGGGGGDSFDDGLDSDISSVCTGNKLMFNGVLSANPLKN